MEQKQLFLIYKWRWKINPSLLSPFFLRVPHLWMELIAAVFFPFPAFSFFPLKATYFCFSFDSSWLFSISPFNLQKSHRLHIEERHFTIGFTGSLRCKCKWKYFPNQKAPSFYESGEPFMLVESQARAWCCSVCKYVLDLIDFCYRESRCLSKSGLDCWLLSWFSFFSSTLSC